MQYKWIKCKTLYPPLFYHEYTNPAYVTVRTDYMYYLSQLFHTSIEYFRLF